MFDENVSEVLLSIKAIDKNKLTEIELKKEDIKFYYRGTNLSEDLIILSVKLKGSHAKKEEIEKKQNEYIEKKKKITAKSN